jgi:hypothetical protein
MADNDAGRFTVGVFQDVPWADKGLAALVRAGLLPESLSVIAPATPTVADLIERWLAGPPQPQRIAGVGDVLVRGPIVRALEGSAADLSTLGLSGTMRRIGFQPHDARIFEALTARGGVLVAIHSEPRAADALAVLHAYGGGNAAIGAWTGRL